MSAVSGTPCLAKAGSSFTVRERLASVTISDKSRSPAGAVQGVG